MKIVLFSLLCLIMMGMTSYSYAETVLVERLGENVTLPEVTLQLTLRDSNENLLAYIEADQILSIDIEKLNIFLDIQNQTVKEFFIKDGKKYESHKWEIVNVDFKKRHAWSATLLVDVYRNEFINLMQIRHDSYQTQPGDTVRIFWTVVLPVS